VTQSTLKQTILRYLWGCA
jgi:hypothetical protein